MPRGTGRHEGTCPTLPLSQVPPRRAVRIHHVDGVAERGKLLALGLVPGAALSVVAARPGGAVLVEIRNRRLVLDRVSAESIEVDRRSAAEEAPACG